MQTFLPYADLVESARCLDSRRLGKQRVEAMQILNILNGHQRSKGWINHPAVRMWDGCAPALGAYMNATIDEWVRRGYRNNMVKVFVPVIQYPWWFGVHEFHSSHRARLLDKQPEWYGRFGWSEAPSKTYWWPTHHGG